MLIQECASGGGWTEVEVQSSSGHEAYKVLLPPWDRGQEEAAICECKGFLFRGRCRHQREALAKVCSWSELDSPPQSEQQKRDKVCPECLGPTRMVMIDDNYGA